MARRADHNHEELSELVISAATQIVKSDTHANLSARRISDMIGYSVGTLYNHFDNLDDIIFHINARTFDLLQSELEQVTLAGDPYKDTISYIRSYLAFLNDNAELWRLIFEHSLPEGQTPPQWYLEKADHILSIYEGALIPIFGSQGDSSKHASRTLWSGLHGITSLHVSGKLKSVSSLSVEEMTAMLAGNFISGLGKEQHR